MLIIRTMCKKLKIIYNIYICMYICMYVLVPYSDSSSEATRNILSGSRSNRVLRCMAEFPWRDSRRRISRSPGEAARSPRWAHAQFPSPPCETDSPSGPARTETSRKSGRKNWKIVGGISPRYVNSIPRRWFFEFSGVFRRKVFFRNNKGLQEFGVKMAFDKWL